MPKSLFEIQTESGQLWPDIAAQLAATQSDFANREPAHDYLVQIREKIREDGLTARQTVDAIKAILAAYTDAKRARRRSELEAEAAKVAEELATLSTPEP